MKLGANSGPPGAALWETIHAATGFPGWRCYGTPGQGVPSSWPGASEPRPRDAGFVIASIKPDVPSVINGVLDDELRAWVAGAAPGDYATLWHEGETGDGWTPAEIKAMHKHAHAVIKAARPDIKYGQISSAYTASAYSAYRPLSQWITKGLDYQGIDGYRSTQRQTVASVFDAARAEIHQAAPRASIAVCEVNSIPTARAEWFHDTYAWAVAHGCLTYFPFFFPTGGLAGDDRYSWDAADAATITTLRGMAV